MCIGLKTPRIDRACMCCLHSSDPQCVGHIAGRAGLAGTVWRRQWAYRMQRDELIDDHWRQISYHLCQDSFLFVKNSGGGGGDLAAGGALIFMPVGAATARWMSCTDQSVQSVRRLAG